MTFDIEQIYSAFLASGCDVAGVEWASFARHLPTEQAQEAPDPVPATWPFPRTPGSPVTEVPLLPMRKVFRQ